MCFNSKFNYNHEVWAKYSFIEAGFDMYRACYEASIPNKPIKIKIGRWFIDLRVYRWQILLNKMTKEQIARMKLSFEWEQQEKQRYQSQDSHLSF